MERDGDLLLNVSCSTNQPSKAAKTLPPRMPDGSKIENNRNLSKKIFKTHVPATSAAKVFIPRHKLPVLDEFGLCTPSDLVATPKFPRMLPELSESQSSSSVKKSHAPKQAFEPSENKEIGTKSTVSKGEETKSILKKSETNETEVDSSSRKAKRKKRKKREEELKIIPKEVQNVAGGLPPSFPQHRIKKFTEEYQMKKRKMLEDGKDEDAVIKKKRRSFVPGLNPRRREKLSSLFTEWTLNDLEDLHPYLVSNLEQNFEIKKLTRIQSIAMPKLLKTRFDTGTKEFIINSGISSGKILSYVVPIVNNLALLEPRIDRSSGIQALVLLPTRELAAKISDIFTKLCRTFLWVVPGLLTGGERKKSEKARLRKGINILITTPGRLIDHIEHTKSVDFAKMKYCILADAHKLLDPERAEVAKQIAIALRKRLPKSCVRCIVTATLTKKLEKLTEILVSNPEIIDAFKEFE